MIFGIQSRSIHDGPGVRTTVYLKGCPMSCPWCHSPEGISPHPELAYQDRRCVLCGDCESVCPTGALSMSKTKGLVLIENDLCSRCRRCQDVCLSRALEVVGRETTVEQVMAAIERDSISHGQSSGGVTFSGGEPLQQPDFLAALLQGCRSRGIHTALDTSGYASPEVIEGIAPLADLFLFDVKVVDDRRHQELTRVSNGQILANLRWIVSQGRPVILRVPVIPGISDDEENLRAIAELARSLHPHQRVDLLPYRAIAAEKHRRLRREYLLSNVQPPSRGRLSQIAAYLEEFGLAVKIAG